MKFTFIRKDDGCWSTDGRWHTPSGPSEIKGAGRPSHVPLPIEDKIKKLLTSNSSADISDPGATPEETVFLWLAGYAPSQACRIFASVLDGKGSHHTFERAYRELWPRLFNGEVVIPGEWMQELRRSGLGPWSQFAPSWFLSFFEPTTPLKNDEGRATVPEELSRSVRALESLHLLFQTAPETVTPNIVFKVLGTPFDSLISEKETAPKSDGAAARERMSKEPGGAGSLLFGIGDKEDYFYFEQLEGVKRMTQGGIPLGAALALHDFPADHFGIGAWEFPGVDYYFDMNTEEGAAEARDCVNEASQNAMQWSPDPLQRILNKESQLVHPDLVPRTNEEIEPLIEDSVLLQALIANGECPNLYRFDQNIIVRAILEIMIEVFYGLSTINWVVSDFDQASPNLPSLQPLRVQARYPGSHMMPKGSVWVPFVGVAPGVVVKRIIGGEIPDEGGDKWTQATEDAIRGGFKPPEKKPLIPLPPIVDFSNPEALQHAMLTGDVSRLFSWRTYTEASGSPPPSVVHPLSAIRTSFDFKVFNRRVINLTFQARRRRLKGSDPTPW